MQPCAEVVMHQTLESVFYTSHEIFEKEKEAIFYKNWQYACHKSELNNSGDYVSFKVGSESLFAIRGKDQIVRAFYNVCPHRGHQLLESKGQRTMIVCPYHAWSFFSDGVLNTARGAKQVCGFDASRHHLKQVHVEEFLGFIFVNLSDGPVQSLRSLSKNLEQEIRDYVPQIDDLVFFHRIPYDVKANWKVVVDNYLECYHCAPAHPDFVDLVNMPSYHSQCHDIYSSHKGQLKSSNSGAYAICEKNAGNHSDFAGFFLWPNMTFTVFPGAPNISVMNMVPVSAEKTFETFDFFFASTAVSEEEQAMVSYIENRLQPEDIGLVESVQRGLNSRAYTSGPLIIDKERTHLSEHALLHFHDLVRKALHQGPNNALANSKQTTNEPTNRCQSVLNND
jgi:choline monooxygenase